MKQFTILEAPSILGLGPTGVERMPEALLKAGLAERLGAARGGIISPADAHNPERPSKHAVLNQGGIAEYSMRLADAIGEILDGEHFPIVLGGDCSILLGSMLALRRRGRYGLLFIDGHADFYQPEAEPKGEGASMDLALVTGRGPVDLVDLEGRGPLVADEDVVVFGFRDGDDQEEYGSQPLAEAMLALDLRAIRQQGIENALNLALTRLADPKFDGVWIHLDADVLDDALMPAVDYRMPGGLSFEELTQVLNSVMKSGKAVGLEVTIFNPAMDPDGQLAAALTDCIARGLL